MHKLVVATNQSCCMYSSIKNTGCFDSRLFFFFSKISSQLRLVYIGPISGSCLFLRG